MAPLLPTLTSRLIQQLTLISLVAIPASTIADLANTSSLSTIHRFSASFPDSNPYQDTVLQGDGYGFINDNDSLLDNLKRIYDEGLALQASSRGLLVIPGDEAELVSELENANNDKTSFSAGGHLALLTQQKDWIVVAGSEFNGSGEFIYDEDDAARLRFATVLGLFNLGELQSAVNVSALWKNYLGINHRFSLQAFPNTLIGITAKLQSISVIERSISIEEYDEDKLFDRGRDVESKFQLNADLGILHQMDNWTFGIDFNDIYQQVIKGSEGTPYQQRTHISGDVHYLHEWGRLGLHADITPQNGFGELASRRAYGVNALLPFSEKLDILLGYTWLDSHKDSDLPTAGLYYHLGDMLRIEAQVSYAGPREFGGGVSLQLPL